jgi:AAA domain/DnaB-like helicase N terminal domain
MSRTRGKGEQVLPQNVEAERAMLGCVLIDPDTLSVVRRFAEPDSLYTDADRTIYQTMCALADAGTPVDLITLCDALARAGHLEDVGGTSYVASLANQVPNSTMAEHYAQIVQRYACARRFIEASASIAAAAYEVPEDVDGAVTYFRTLIDEARGEGQSRAAPFHLLSIAEILNQPRPDALIHGLYTLNSTGIKFSPPGVGKTALLLDQMAHVALGRAWEEHPVHTGHVVYVCAEGQAFLPERFEALMLKLGVQDIPRLHILPVRVQMLEPRTVPGLIATFAAELSEMPVWVAFDTVSQTAGGADENDANDMRDYVNAMDRIRDATSAFVDAIHHTGPHLSCWARSVQATAS